jgi:hypothetical protein
VLVLVLVLVLVVVMIEYRMVHFSILITPEN